MMQAVRTAVPVAVALALTLAVGSASAAVNSAQGIYLTGDDFLHGRLTSADECAAVDHKIELHDILNKPYIHVTHGGEVRKYLKSDVYGFRACDGRDYRFVGNREYDILEARDLSIYSIELFVREGEDLGIGDETVYQFFFSAGAVGAVQPLTRDNLKRAFPQNHTLHDKIDLAFQTDKDLVQYDTFHKMFKVNRLLMAADQP